MGRRSTVLAIAGAYLLLAGCAAVPPLMLADLAVNGASQIATGKTLRDHALSAVLAEDCALNRGFAGEAICRPLAGPQPAPPPRPVTHSALGGIYAGVSPEFRTR